MAEEKALYGMGDDSVNISSSMKFGLNAGKTVMEKFEFTDKGGKDGAAQEALDIVFKIGSTSKSYRIFPVTKDSKFFGEGNTQVVFGDPEWTAKANEAVKELNDKVTHIMKSFVTTEQLDAKLKGGFKTFKEYVGVLMNTLPKNFAEIKLDLFLHWQWKISGDNDKTYLEIPTKMKYGKWVCAAVEPVGGEWKEDRSDGLHYKDEAGNFHPFGRNDYYMGTAHATQQKEASAEDTMGTSTATNSQAVAADSDNSGW